MTAAAPAGRAADPVRVGMVVASVSRRGGGVVEVLRGVTRHLRDRPGTRVEVFGLADPHTEEDRPAWRGVPVSAHPVLGPPAIGYSPGLDRALRGGGLHVAHVHGLWMYVSLAARRWASAAGRPYLVSPHGHLDAWALARHPWRKRLALALHERANLEGAACLHALCERELASIRALGLVNPVCVVPNGIDPPTVAAAAPPAWAAEPGAGARTLLFLGRVTPQKGLANLLKAWRTARRAGEPWRLVIAGWDQFGHTKELRALAGALGVAASVRFVGPQHGADKEAALAFADAFVLPSVSEGLPMAALEAWARGLPVLMTPACNLPEGFAAGAALRAEPEPESLAEGLERLFALSDQERRAMGARGRLLTLERFSWARVADEMEGVYRWLARGGPAPPCVRMP